MRRSGAGTRPRDLSGQPEECIRHSNYWSASPERLLTDLCSSANGLSQREAERRLDEYGPNTLKPGSQTTALGLLLNQFKSPLVLILIVAAIISIVAGEWPDAMIVLAVVAGSTGLGFVQEYRASDAIEKLRSKLMLKSSALRDGESREVLSQEIVPGDVVLLSAGSLIPADGLVLEADDLFVNQAVLTGEVYPVEKRPETVEPSASLMERINCVFMGTSVRSGTARVLIVQTARETVYGQVAERLKLRPPETEFERGVEGFGFLLTRVMLAMVVIVIAMNAIRGKPALDSLLFALALAVGLTPELLPAIISVTLAHGAQRMAKQGVIVRRLNAIENFGSMQVLCTDKTGTLTEGTVLLKDAVDSQGQASADVLRYAYLNAFYQSGLKNPLDEAIVVSGQRVGQDAGAVRKVGEIPYDFIRKRLSVVVEDRSGVQTLITKGALESVLDLCNSVHSAGKAGPLDEASRQGISALYRQWSAQGFRVLGVGFKEVDAGAESYTRDDEAELQFVGFLLFFDPPKPDVVQTIVDLRERGVELKIITGDNQLVARHIAETVDLPVRGVLTGKNLHDLGDESLWHTAERTTIFAEVDPNQKERIILALRKTGHVVGYMGDGINDAPALHAADVGISVNTAVDVAKDAADLVLLEQSLDILRDGIDEGRRTFANTLKYILTTTSANFGNMFSMAAATMFLPFLPLTASQILLNNFLSDIPGTTIAGDNVDPEWVAGPRRWDNRFISRYMVLFGLVSSIFDFLTFGTLLFVFQATVEEFRTGWFIESLLTELVIALVVRTRRVCFRSRPGNLLLASTIIVIGVTLLLPYLPSHSLFGFVPLPAPLMLVLIGLTVLYVLAAEMAKTYFYSRVVNARFLAIGQEQSPAAHADKI
ncbi:MAG: magnesium-translocating P-type ATPase [Pirellulales bacterium]|nr:magnesium-translocating P-type ATPase [Pirellulales bacterium]